MLASTPVLRINATCSGLGYDAVGRGAVFEYQTYWRGGEAAHEVFMSKYRAGHPDIDRFLNRTRDGNPACGHIERLKTAPLLPSFP